MAGVNGLYRLWNLTWVLSYTMEMSHLMTRVWKMSVMRRRDDLLNEMHRVYMHRINELLVQEANLRAEIQTLFDRHLEEGDARMQQEQVTRAATKSMGMGQINPQSNGNESVNVNISSRHSRDDTLDIVDPHSKRADSVKVIASDLSITNIPPLQMVHTSSSHRISPFNYHSNSMPSGWFIL